MYNNDRQLEFPNEDMNTFFQQLDKYDCCSKFNKTEAVLPVTERMILNWEPSRISFPQFIYAEKPLKDYLYAFMERYTGGNWYHWESSRRNPQTLFEKSF